MATVVEKLVRRFGPHSAGTLMTPREFDQADFVEGWRYELIGGRLIVSPIPLENERTLNDELGYLLRAYRDTHPKGSSLDETLFEQTVRTLRTRRRADRVIWAGLARPPRRRERPGIVIEIVSADKRDRTRDYEEKCEEYMAVQVQEYWIIERFERIMTVFSRKGGRIQKRVIKANQVYTTPLLPGFELPLSKLFAIADRWPENDPEAL